jgi:hypothetical protein
MQTTGGCGRVVKNKNKDGSIRSFGFSIVRNKRVNSRATHVLLSPLMTLKQSELITKANAFWKLVDEKVSELTKSGTLWANDQSKIESHFSTFVPRPAAVTKTLAPSPKSDHELLRNLIKEVAEKTEKRLKPNAV